MVNRLRLNEKSVREAEPVKGRDYQIFDTDVRGFAVCIYRSGSRAFTIDYRYAGRQRRMTIGRWPEWSATAARERAKELRREIDAGGDPLGQKETGRDAPRFKDLIDRYTEVHLPHLSPTNASDQKSMLAKMVAPDWGNKLVTEITPYDVEKLLNKVAAGRARPSKAKPNIRDIMLEAVERRFADHRVPSVIEMLSDNGSPFVAKDTQIFARQLGLQPCFTPVQSQQSNGISEAFVKTLKRAYVQVTPLPDAQTVLGLIGAWIEDYNDKHRTQG